MFFKFKMQNSPVFCIFFLILSILFISCVSIPDDAVQSKDIQTLSSLEDTHTISAILLADAHFTDEKPLFEMLVKLVNRLEPDIIFFTGDQAVSKKSIKVMKTYLSKITVNCPKVAIDGNWEYMKDIQDSDDYLSALADNGVTHLRNSQFSYVKDNKELVIYGLDSFLFGEPSMENYIPKENAANVILGHCPPLFDMLPSKEQNNGIPIFMLCGHTHGGQFTFFHNAVYFPVGTNEYYVGKYEKNGNELYVSTGIGNSTLDVRNVPPVIDIITFTFDDNNRFISAKTQQVKIQ